MADIDDVVTVSLTSGGTSVAPDNMNVVSIITSTQGVLSTANRYGVYTQADDVASVFGASSQESAFANSVFATDVNPVDVGGVLVIGYWRGASETVEASAATLVSEQTTEATIVPIMQAITDGSFTITVDGGTEIEATGVNGTGVSEMADIVTLLNANITGATVSESNGYFTVTSDTTGVTSLLTYFGEQGAGTDLSTVLGLSSVTGAVLTQGAAEVTLAPETKLEGITAVKAKVNIKGAMFIDQVLDADVPGMASFAVANDMLMYDVFDENYLSKDVSNPVWAVKLAGQSNYRCLLSAAGNRKLAATHMARMHSVLSSGTNTAITMNLKELSVAAEEYDKTTLTAAESVGLDLFTTIKDDPVLLTSGANDFCDNVYNSLSLKNEIQTDAYNLLKGVSTKISQTDEGMSTIEDGIEQTCKRYITNGVGAPGKWTSSTFFGDKAQFNTAIETDGYYVLMGDVADQSTADREARKATIGQVAFKFSGAVHKENIIINVNK